MHRLTAAERRDDLAHLIRFDQNPRALDLLDGPTIPGTSMMSIKRPALAKPTRSRRCSIEVEPSCVSTTSSTA